MRGAPGPDTARTPRGAVSPRRAGVTVVEPHGPGIASAVARRCRRPVSAYALGALAGWALLAAAISALGLLLVHVVLRSGAISDADEWLPRRLAEHRRPWLTDASDVGSRIADVPVLPAIVVLVLIASVVARRMRVGVFLATAIVIELTLYRLGALVAPRERPDVVRLDDLPVDESFPSGHVAAATVVYVGLALIVSSWARRRWVTATAWTIAVAIVLTVATSRMYRGMHHPIDALSGALLGAGCLVVAVIAVRAYGHAAERRAERTTGAGGAAESPELPTEGVRP